MRKKFFIIILAIISLLFISILGGYIAFNNMKIESKVEEIENEIENEIEVKEVEKETRFYTLVNNEKANFDVSRKVVKEYLNSYENPEEENKILGLNNYEILEIFEGRKPSYQVKYEEYKDGILLEDYPGKNKELWAYSLYNDPNSKEKDDSGLYLYLERDENHDLVVVDAYIDTLIGSPEHRFHNEY